MGLSVTKIKTGYLMFTVMQYLRSPMRTSKYRLPFLMLMRAFLLKRMVSPRMVGLVNLANRIPTMQPLCESS